MNCKWSERGGDDHLSRLEPDVVGGVLTLRQKNIFNKEE